MAVLDGAGGHGAQVDIWGCKEAIVVSCTVVGAVGNGVMLASACTAVQSARVVVVAQKWIEAALVVNLVANAPLTGVIREAIGIHQAALP